MSLEDFQIFGKKPFDNTIIKRDFLKVYHQQGAQLNQPDQNIEFIFGENNNYYQRGKACLEIDITVRKNDTTNFHNDDPSRLVNNGFAFCFKEASYVLLLLVISTIKILLSSIYHYESYIK